MPRVQDALPSLDCRAWKGRSNPLLLNPLRFAPESRHAKLSRPTNRASCPGTMLAFPERRFDHARGAAPQLWSAVALSAVAHRNEKDNSTNRGTPGCTVNPATGK